MSISTKHPQYAEFIEDWRTCRDAHSGQRAVKRAGVRYLPKTQAMAMDGNEGNAEYAAYLQRAAYHDHMEDSVEASMGSLHQHEAQIELPRQLEPMRDKATSEDESLLQALQRINKQQLIAGRLGVLVDAPAESTANRRVPYLALYHAERIINWDSGSFGNQKKLVMVVLDESGVIRSQMFQWELNEKYRVLMLGQDGIYAAGVFDGETDEQTFDPRKMVVPSHSGDNDFIPFTFINSRDLLACPDKPPLLGLADLSMHVYRMEADHRQHLFMQGQDTLVLSGVDDADGDKTFRTGAGAVIKLDTDGKAQYIGVQSQGLPERRAQLESDKQRLDRYTGRLIHSDKKDRESGAALFARQAGQSATLLSIALFGAAGLEQSLRQAAIWAGANPDEVSVAPNLDFTADTMTADELLKLITAARSGLPLSDRSIHKILLDKGISKEEFEEEMRVLDAERKKREADAPDPVEQGQQPGQKQEPSDS